MAHFNQEDVPNWKNEENYRQRYPVIPDNGTKPVSEPEAKKVAPSAAAPPRRETKQLPQSFSDRIVRLGEKMIKSLDEAEKRSRKPQPGTRRYQQKEGPPMPSAKGILGQVPNQSNRRPAATEGSERVQDSSEAHGPLASTTNDDANHGYPYGLQFQDYVNQASPLSANLPRKQSQNDNTNLPLDTQKIEDLPLKPNAPERQGAPQNEITPGDFPGIDYLMSPHVSYTYEDLKSYHAQLLKRSQFWENSYREFGSEISFLKKENQRLTDENRMLETERGAWEAKIQTEKEDNERLTMLSRSSKADNERLDALWRSFKVENDGFKANNRNMYMEIQRLEKEESSTKEKLHAVITECDRLRIENQKWKDQTTRLDTECLKVKEAAESAKSELSAFIAKYDAVLTEIDRFEDKFTRLNTNYLKLMEENDLLKAETRNMNEKKSKEQEEESKVNAERSSLKTANAILEIKFQKAVNASNQMREQIVHYKSLERQFAELGSKYKKMVYEADTNSRDLKIARRTLEKLGKEEISIVDQFVPQDDEDIVRQFHGLGENIQRLAVFMAQNCSQQLNHSRFTVEKTDYGSWNFNTDAGAINLDWKHTRRMLWTGIIWSFVCGEILDFRHPFLVYRDGSEEIMEAANHMYGKMFTEKSIELARWRAGMAELFQSRKPPEITELQAILRRIFSSLLVSLKSKTRPADVPRRNEYTDTVIAQAIDFGRSIIRQRAEFHVTFPNLTQQGFQKQLHDDVQTNVDEEFDDHDSETEGKVWYPVKPGLLKYEPSLGQSIQPEKQVLVKAFVCLTKQDTS